MSLNYVREVMVGKPDGTANNAASTSAPLLKKNEIAILNYETGLFMTGTSNTVKNAPIIQFAVGTGSGRFLLSSPIEGKLIESCTRNNYVAPVKQETFIGYNGTDGTLTVAPDTEYEGSIVYPTELRLECNKQDKNTFSVRTGATASAYELARAIKVDINMQEQVYVEASIHSDGTDAAIAQSATVVKGTRRVVYGGNHGLVAGDMVRLSTAGLFKVAEVESNTVVLLDTNYHLPTQVLASGATKKVTSITKYGVKLVAKDLVFATVMDKYNIVTFEVGISESFGFSAKTVTAGNPGRGLPIQIKELEHACAGNLGHTDFRSFDRAPFPYQVDLEAAGYNTVELNYMHKLEGDLQSNRYLPGAVSLCYSTAANGQIGALKTPLNAYLASVGITDIA